MSNLIVPEGIRLVPVVELMPCKFSDESRRLPSGPSAEDPDEWFRYWTDSLADSGITGLQPLRWGSWHVPTVNFDRDNLRRFLEKSLNDWGGIDSLADLDGRPNLDGGLALLCRNGDVLVQPGCCSDLGDADNWREAAAYRGVEWRMLWIGHPWLSVRHQSPWLVLSGPHESDTPTDRWAVSPEELDRAVDEADAELERFAGDLTAVLPMLGFQEDAATMGLKLAGLSE